MASCGDDELVKRTLEGDRQAFEQIVERYQRLVFNIVFHYFGSQNEVEDMAQEVFLRVYRSLDRFDPTRSLKAWIGRITANRCVDELRRRRRRRQRLFTDLSEEEKNQLDWLRQSAADGDSFSQPELSRCFGILQKSMEALSESDRMAFVLREVEGLEYREIADMLKCSELAARIRVSRSRKKLKKELGRVFHEE